MQTFKQFLEAREVRNIKSNSFYDILRHINDSIICVKFVLYCAEDCFHLNNETTKPAARNCITLIRKRLNDPQSVTEEEFSSAADAAVAVYTTDRAAYDAAVTAAYAVYAVEIAYSVDIANTSAYAGDTASNVAYYASYAFADASKHRQNSPEWDRIRDRKLQEYIERLKSLATTRSGNPITTPFLNDIQDDDNDLDDPKYINNNILSSIASMIDWIHENETTTEHDFFYEKDNKFVFDLGNNVKLTADHMQELAEKIYKNKYFLRRLKELYRANV